MCVLVTELLVREWRFIEPQNILPKKEVWMRQADSPEKESVTGFKYAAIYSH